MKSTCGCWFSSLENQSGNPTDIMFYCKLEDFFKGVDGVLAAYGVTFAEADVIVGG